MEKIKTEVAQILTRELQKYFGPNPISKLTTSEKEDKSFVTEIDLLVSKIIKEKLKDHSQFKNYSFFSEEDYEALDFPSAILDPIDGTLELIRGVPECVVSLALMNSKKISDTQNYAWLYNPFTGFSLDSSTSFYSHLNRVPQQTLGFVSRSEWHKGYFKDVKDKNIVLTPRGSIAFKLGLLASGACDFVVSLAPKNIWDIAAGTILLDQRGIFLYCNGVRVTDLDKIRFEDTLLWCQESLLGQLLTEFNSEK